MEEKTIIVFFVDVVPLLVKNKGSGLNIFLFSFLIFIFFYSTFRTRVRVRVTRSCCHMAGHIG